MAFCAKCGAANADTSSFCGACGAPVSTPAAGTAAAGAPPPPAVPQAQKKSGAAQRAVIIIFVTLICFVILGAMVYYNTGTGDAKPAADTTCRDSSFGYLANLQGGSGEANMYWKPGVTPQALIGVHSFKVMMHGDFLQSNGKPYKVRRVYYKYEVESTNQAGIPIRKRWDIVMEQDTKSFMDQPCAIVQIVEAE